MTTPPSAKGRRGFTVTELLVVAVIVVILLSIFVPYVRAKREDARRVRCMDNLGRIRAALAQYMQQNRNDYPATRRDAEKPAAYRAFTGPDAADPFAADSAVRPNDVTASLWLLVRQNLAAPNLFVCPSTSDVGDEVTGPATSRSNFRSSRNLSYSYASPFAAPNDYRLNGDWLRPRFVVLADRNPGVGDGGRDNVLAASTGDPSAGNSRNHGKAGQAVLFGDGHVEFTRTPYTGHESDNIYTAQRATPLATGETHPTTAPGVLDRAVGPAWSADSYLVPTAHEAE